jgi:hypothetical protein
MNSSDIELGFQSAGKRAVGFPLRSISRNGSAAFHGGELELACSSIMFLVTR